MEILFSLLPVVIYLILLIYLDSFKLIKPRYILYGLFWGMCTATAIYSIAVTLFGITLPISFDFYSHIMAPFLEEIVKCLLLYILIKNNKIGFMIDAAIIGFAIGTGFALVENITYLEYKEIDNLYFWAVRGFGTAVMHGGASAIAAVTTMYFVNMYENFKVSYFVVGLGLCIGIHLLYNNFLVTPFVSTLIVMTVIPTILIYIFKRNSKYLNKWLDVELYTEAQLLKAIKDGTFSSTKAGRYFLTIKNNFLPETLVDMLCLIQIYLELSIKAKAIILLKEAGMDYSIDTEIEQKLLELKALEKNIGYSGMLALKPIIRYSKKDLWKINLIED